MEVLSIRDPKHLSEYPELHYIREAIIKIYDSLIKPDQMIENYGFLAGEIQKGVKEFNEDPKYIESATHFYFETLEKCGSTSLAVKNYLDNFRIMFSCAVISSDRDQDLKHFRDLGHCIVIIYSNISNNWFACSPANIFNKDLSLPEINGTAFDRSVTVFAAENYVDLINLVIEAEGGSWPSEADVWQIFDLYHITHVVLEEA